MSILIVPSGIITFDCQAIQHKRQGLCCYQHIFVHLIYAIRLPVPSYCLTLGAIIKVVPLTPHAWLELRGLVIHLTARATSSFLQRMTLPHHVGLMVRKTLSKFLIMPFWSCMAIKPLFPGCFMMSLPLASNDFENTLAPA